MRRQSRSTGSFSRADGVRAERVRKVAHLVVVAQAFRLRAAHGFCDSRGVTGA